MKGEENINKQSKTRKMSSEYYETKGIKRERGRKHQIPAGWDRKPGREKGKEKENEEKQKRKVKNKEEE